MPGIVVAERSGLTIVEQVLCNPVSTGQAAQVPARRWPLGQNLEAALSAITPMDGTDASSLCGVASAPWALYCATDRGEVIALCPMGGKIEPMHVIIAAPALLAAEAHAPGGDEVLGLHLDDTGIFWLLVKVWNSTRTELRGWTADSGAPHGTWPLPPGRKWTSGLCGLRRHQGFIAASNRLSDLGAHPEVWWFDVNKSNSESESLAITAATFLASRVTHDVQL